jgi:hypothetical protein
VGLLIDNAACHRYLHICNLKFIGSPDTQYVIDAVYGTAGTGKYSTISYCDITAPAANGTGMVIYGKDWHIHHNSIHHCPHDGIAIKGIEVIIEDNLIFDNYDPTDGGSDGIQVPDTTVAGWFIVRRNYIRNNPAGVKQCIIIDNDYGPVYVYDNECEGGGGSNISVRCPAGYVFRNYLHDTPGTGAE